MTSAGFVACLLTRPSARVVFDGETKRWYTRGELAERVIAAAAALRFPKKAVGYVFAANDIDSIVAYLASIEAGNAVVMLDPEMDPGFRERLTAQFEPDYIVAPRKWEEGDRYTASALTESRMVLWTARDPHRHAIHPDLTLLISTSGSTGSAKLVRLTWRNMVANARGIIAELGHDERDCNVLTAPAFNAYGQSVVNTSLLAGGRFVLSEARLVSREFWDVVRTSECNTIGGTPYFYQVLDRLDLDALNVPLLKKFIQTGGRLSEELVRKFHQRVTARGGRLHIMYGQAEATARVCGLPPEYLPEAARSIGRPLGNYKLTVMNDGRECGPMEEGELTLEAPTVMMGYALSPADLGAEDQMHGRVATGDLGYRDERGLFYITGRKARFAKLFGWRVSLDDVEELLAGAGPVCAVNEGERVVVYCENGAASSGEHIAGLAERLRIHPSAFAWRTVERIPRLINGKPDYKGLAAKA